MSGRTPDHHARTEPPVSSRTADPETLRRAYDRCRRTAAVHGRTYYLATRLLSAEQRPAVHALYAFARMVDDIVDDPVSPRQAAAVLDDIELALRISWTPLAAPVPPDPARLRATAPLGPPQASTGRPFDPSRSATAPLPPPRPGATAPPDPPRPSAIPALEAPRLGRLPAGFGEIALALTDTVAGFCIDPRHFWTFLDSMRMDAPGSPLFRNRYPTMAALDEYMRGSAAAIGLQLLPVLGTVGPRAAAEPAAAALGNAFQLTNFLRDIGEDLDRGRIYLPADELAAFGVDEELLVHCRRARSIDPRVRRALAHLIAVNRDLYRRAYPGIELLSPRVRPGIRTAATVYAAILDLIEESDYNVFARRAVVPDQRRLWLAVGAAVRR
ncbi:phytoene/squalene synthase family protein [Nocardia carnea]|uniref:phytoene/squalene synthase family protein n=1 Tax=Nocardia carnea TaxID=37328 RepID=UPI002457915B|nr:phytoene/squalene synthase family protein [Nocardia carnea]